MALSIGKTKVSSYCKVVDQLELKVRNQRSLFQDGVACKRLHRIHCLSRKKLGKSEINLSTSSPWVFAINPIRSGLFQTANDPGGGGGFKITPPPTISKTIVSLFTL